MRIPSCFGRWLRDIAERMRMFHTPFCRVLSLFTVSILFLSSVPNVHAIMSVGEERKMRQKLLAEIESQVPLVTDPEVVEYVSDIGHNILAVINGKYFDYRFFVIKDDALNAFATPGGLIFVHTGLIEAIDSDNELACILAHECGHVQARHIAKRMDQMKVVNIGTAVMAIASLFLGGGQGSQALLTSSMALGQTLSLKYSRQDEEEADRRAYQWICRAGYDPMGLVTTLQKMTRNRFLGSDTIPSYLSTHPGASQRITYIEDLAKQHPCPEKKQEDHLRLRRIQIRVKLMTQDPDRLVAYYQRELKDKPDDLLMHYGLAMALMATREYREAFREFDTVMRLAPDKEEFKIDLGRALLAAGRYRQALPVLRDYCEHYPTDYAGRYFLGRAFLDNGMVEEALSIFRGVESEWPDYMNLYLEMGRAYSRENNKGMAHYYLFQYYRRIGDRQSAMYHRAMALKSLPPDSEYYKKLKRAGNGPAKGEVEQGIGRTGDSE